MAWGSPMRWISSIGSQKISKREKSWFGPESERYPDLFATIFTSKQKQTCYRWFSDIPVSYVSLFHEFCRIFDFCLSAWSGQNRYSQTTTKPGHPTSQNIFRRALRYQPCIWITFAFMWGSFSLFYRSKMRHNDSVRLKRTDRKSKIKQNPCRIGPSDRGLYRKRK